MKYGDLWRGIERSVPLKYCSVSDYSESYHKTEIFSWWMYDKFLVPFRLPYLIPADHGGRVLYPEITMSSEHSPIPSPSPLPINNDKVRTSAASPIASDIIETHQVNQMKIQPRFVMKSAKKKYVVRTLQLYNIHKARVCDVNNLCDKVAHNVASRFVSDVVIE